jgi:hypothetical protein
MSTALLHNRLNVSEDALPKKNKRIIACTFLGAIVATLMTWGGLFLFGVLILHGKGSLFDTNPTAANIFFTIWLILIFVGATVGAYVGQASSKK